MPAHRSFLIASILSSTALPLACSGGGSPTPGAGKTSGGTGAFAGSAGTRSNFGGGGLAGGGSLMGGGGGRPGFEGLGGDTSIGGQPGDGQDLGVAERRPYCLAVCAYGPSPSSRVTSADAGAAPEAGGAPGAGGEARGGVPGGGGEGGAPDGTPCGHVDGCVASLCPTQNSERCGELLTTFVECMAKAGPEVVASLVTSCTETAGPSLDTLIYQACYGQYADFTRGCP